MLLFSWAYFISLHTIFIYHPPNYELHSLYSSDFISGKEQPCRHYLTHSKTSMVSSCCFIKMLLLDCIVGDDLLEVILSNLDSVADFISTISSLSLLVSGSPLNRLFEASCCRDCFFVIITVRSRFSLIKCGLTLLIECTFYGNQISLGLF